MKKIQSVIMAVSLAGVMSSSASTTFGSLPAATFGGSGNPNSAVEVTTITDGGNTVTLGLAAQQRYDNPALGNNGNATYYATTGANFGNPLNPADTSHSSNLGATWNFDFYANIAGGGDLSTYTFILKYQLTPGGPMGSLNLNNIAFFSGTPTTSTTLQDSENLNFSYLAVTIPGFVTAPGGTFNPNATGNYAFSLEADKAGSSIGESDITVDVAAVPEPSTILAGALLLLPFGASALRKLRKNRAV
jgi:hypothetical protein